MDYVHPAFYSSSELSAGSAVWFSRLHAGAALSSSFAHS